MDELEARIETLERAVTDGDHDLSELAAEGETHERVAAVETEIDDLTDRVAELEAATQALRGYVGNVRAVNRDVEKRADTALSKVESVESALDETVRTEPDGDRPGAAARGEQPSNDGVTGRATDGVGSARSAGNTGNGDRGGTTAGPVGDGFPSTGGAENGDDAPGSGARSPSSGTTNGVGRRFGRPHERENTTPAGDGDDRDRGAAGRSGRCDACGRPKPDDTGSSPRDPSPDTGVGDAAPSGSRSGVDDPLDAVFETDSGQNDADGTFDRIRQML